MLNKKIVFVIFLILISSLGAAAILLTNNSKTFFPIPNPMPLMVEKYVIRGYGEIHGVIGEYIIKIEDADGCIILSGSHGASMYPIMGYENSMVVDTCFPAEKLKFGDVITFTNEEGLSVVHRVVENKIAQRILITKGDNNKSLDAPVPYDSYKGKVIGFFNNFEEVDE